MPSHRADTPPLRRPRSGRSTGPGAAPSAANGSVSRTQDIDDLFPGGRSTLTLDRPPVVAPAPAFAPVATFAPAVPAPQVAVAPAAAAPASRRAAREARALREAQAALQTDTAQQAQALRDEQSARDAKAYIERRAANLAHEAELARDAEAAERALAAEQAGQAAEELDSRTAAITRRSSNNRRPQPKKAHGHLSASQVGIAGVLGIATIAAPISGAMASPAPKAQLNPIQASAAPSTSVSAQFPALPGAGGTVVAFNAMPSTAMPAAETPSLIAAPRTVLVTRASRAGERSVLPGCDGVAKITNSPNGQIPASSLCTLWDPKHSLRADAAVAIAKMNVAYKQHFGNDICLTDSYRTLSEQYRLRSLKPGLAAVPGTSEHGWGLAVDLCDGVQTGSGARFQWLRDNATAYGWDNPDWARPGGSGPHEPWHWEYVAGETESHPGQ